MKVTTDACLFGAWAAQQIQQSKLRIHNLLDIGCGSGLLSLMIAQKNELLIDAVEIEKNAAGQATENVLNSPWKTRINVIEDDVLAWQTDKKFDCIVSNPPFYENELRSALKQKNIAHHDEGLKLEELFAFIKNHLAEGGIFFLLLPAKREAELSAAMKQFNLHAQQTMIVKQSVNHNPFRLMIQAGTLPMPSLRDEMAIKDNTDRYTPEFHSLLKDYYLYL